MVVRFDGVTVDLLRLLILALYSAFLLSRAFRTRPGFATWHMFVSFSHASFFLTYVDQEGDVVELNPWDYLPHTALAIDRPLVDFFLLYIKAFHGISAQGKIRLKSGTHEAVLNVYDSCVVG